MNYYSAEYYISNKHAFVFKNMICSKLTKKLKDPHKELLVTHQPQTLSALHQLCFKPIWENNNSNLNKFVPFDFWDWCWLSLKQGECSTHNGSYWNITAHHPHTAFEFGQLFQLKISHCFQVSLDIHDLVIFFFFEIMGQSLWRCFSLWIVLTLTWTWLPSTHTDVYTPKSKVNSVNWLHYVNSRVLVRGSVSFGVCPILW